MESLNKAIEISGGAAILAREIDVSIQRLSNWRARGVPHKYCPAIERATNGAVRCEDLRPDVDWAYLRNSGKDAA